MEGMSKVIVAATQMKCTPDRDENIAKADELVKKAAAKGAKIILLQELFETLYFCKTEKPQNFQLATELGKNPAVLHFSRLARELEVVLPISFFEKKNQAHYNTVATIDADGRVLGIYRKTHIPDGPGYEEKFYFNPGNTGFRVWKTRYAKIGIGICWDQWFPEAARSMILQGADILFYPTAIGSDPLDPKRDSMEAWQICMRGHAAANFTPVVASNRIGTESIDNSSITFYGSSFIAGSTGQLLAEADRSTDTIITAELDLERIKADRSAWGFFRDRRPEMYRVLMTLDGDIDQKD
jgi:N-carbamoylputrescine amidase